MAVKLAVVAPGIILPFWNQVKVAPGVEETAVKRTESPVQRVVEPVTLMPGAAGGVLAVTVVAAETALLQPFRLAVTV